MKFLCDIITGSGGDPQSAESVPFELNLKKTFSDQKGLRPDLAKDLEASSEKKGNSLVRRIFKQCSSAGKSITIHSKTKLGTTYILNCLPPPEPTRTTTRESNPPNNDCFIPLTLTLLQSETMMGNQIPHMLSTNPKHKGKTNRDAHREWYDEPSKDPKYKGLTNRDAHREWFDEPSKDPKYKGLTNRDAHREWYDEPSKDPKYKGLTNREVFSEWIDKLSKNPNYPGLTNRKVLSEMGIERHEEYLKKYGPELPALLAASKELIKNVDTAPLASSTKCLEGAQKRAKGKGLVFYEIMVWYLLHEHRDTPIPSPPPGFSPDPKRFKELTG
ncbi:hypothetical protein TrRE_jg11416, partial [Triparma retinervis]